VVRGIEEQLSGACTTEIAAFDEFTGLLTDSALTQAYDHIMFRHRAHRPHHPPAAVARRLERLSGRRARATPPAWGRWPGWRSSAASTRPPSMPWPTPRTRLVLVARAQRPTLREAARTHTELAAIGLSKQYLVVNGVLPGRRGRSRPAGRRDRRARAGGPGRHARRADPAAHRPDPLKAFNLVGLDALRHLLGDSAPISAAPILRPRPRWSRPALPRWWTTSPPMATAWSC
jgi:arsenite-transporting ATPase